MGAGPRCPQERHLPGTRLVASMSPSTGPVPTSVTWTSPAYRTCLMPSAAFGLVDHSHLDTPELNFLAFKTPTSPLPPSLGLLASLLPSPATSQSSLCPCSPYPLTFSGLWGDPSTCLSTVLQATASTVSQVLHPYCQPALTPGPGSHLPPAAFLVSVAQILKLNEFTAECFISLSLWGSRA